MKKKLFSSILLLLSFAFLNLVACATSYGSKNIYQTGLASWYGKKYHGKRTASGERFDMHALTAAHKKLKFGSKVRVVEPKSGKSVIVRINDRGPYTKKRVIDLSRAAAKKIGLIQKGTAKVELYLVE